MKKIFAFDLGKSSIGICVREGHDILKLKSLIINPDYGNIDDNRNRKRIIKIRNAHKKREEFFIKEIWQKCGLEPLSKQDNRFKKEFPSKNENIIYSSSLLRIALLQNHPLEKWQIYKALYNAIQRRGYDNKLPWMNGKKAEKTKDDEENTKYIENYNKLLKETILDDNYHYPCYLDASLMGLWNYLEPNKLNLRISHTASPARYENRVAPRKLVEKELKMLFDNAKSQIPELENISTNYFLYGIGEIPYASYEKEEFSKYIGKSWDNQGVLSQKIPRFDNRILSKCQLMPKRNVCKANTIENIKFVLLLQLKNFRYKNALGQNISLSADQIKQAYEKREPDLKKYIKEGKFQNCKIGSSIIKEVIKPDKLGEETKIEIKVNTQGRSRFCTPALKILSNIILSGKSPLEFDITPYIQNNDETKPEKGITKSELIKVIKRLGDSWQNFHIGDNRDEIAEYNIPKEQKIAKLINSTNPIIRHRLQWFYNELKNLDENYGTPDNIIIEFVRGDKNDALAQKYIIDQNKNEKNNKQIRKKLEESNLELSPNNFERMKLYELQQGKCVYTGQDIERSEILDCQIDHIVPVSRGGCDSLYNKVLCTAQANQEKGNKTPYEWLCSNDENWIKYLQRISKMEKLGNKKQELLISPDATEQIESYNALAETAQIARTAQQIVAIHFGWKLHAKDNKQHVFVSNGSKTAEFRKKYKLNQLLGNASEKNRNNPKHHALDAICISYSRDIKSFQKIDGKWTRGVEGLKVDYIAKKIEELIPKTIKPNTSKQKIKETIYGKIIKGNMIYLASRKKLVDIENTEKAINKIIDDEIKEDLLNKVKDFDGKEMFPSWQAMLKEYHHPKRNVLVKKVKIKETETQTIDLDGNGRERIGKYCDFGNKETKGQFKAADQHQGQFIYFDEKNIPRIMPVYANQKKSEVKAILKNKNYSLYKNGMFLYSTVQLNIKKDFMAGKNIHPAGIYELNTIKTRSAVIKIKNSNGEIISSSAKNLINADFEIYQEEKLLKKD